MQDRPTASELLLAVQRFLDTEIVPATDGRRQFLTRVASNIIRIVEREFRSGDQHLTEEWRRLDALLGPESPPDNREELAAGISRRTAALCAEISGGKADSGPYADQVFAHVEQTVSEKLLVNNPGWLGE